MTDTDVRAALLRVLHMLIAHVRHHDRDDLVPALRHQIDLLLDALRTTPALHRADLERLEAIGTGHADPADHSRTWAGPDRASAPGE